MIWTILLIGVLLVTLGYVLSLLFHWVKYGASLPWVWVAAPIYLGGVFVLLTIAFSAYRGLMV